MIKKQIFSVITTGAMLLNIVAPVAAQTNSIEITGNGAEANSVAEVTTTNTTNVTQTNTASVNNFIKAESTSGGNTTSKNTGGNTLIDTGKATTVVDVANLLNSNSATVDCCAQGAYDVKISGNGAGDEEENGSAKATVNGGGNVVNLGSTNTTNLVQDNDAHVGNHVWADSNSGDNYAGKNTGGDVRVYTDDAATQVGVSTTANNNMAKIGGTSVLPTGVSAQIMGNGAETDNFIGLQLANSVGVYQDNEADVHNFVGAGANSGDNGAYKNTNGDVTIDTGKATSIVGVDNKLNFNWADVNCCGVFDVTAKISGNGSESYNKIGLGLTNSQTLTQDNGAHVNNMIFADANSGHNWAPKNTGGDVLIVTGNATLLLGVDNMVNFNWADVDCCVTGLDAFIKGNGSESTNSISAVRANTKGTWQTNLAGLSNFVKHADSNTGENKAKENTGDPSSDPAIYTGDGTTVMSVSNVANLNSEGATPAHDFPEVEFDFDFSWTHHVAFMASIWSMLF